MGTVSRVGNPRWNYELVLIIHCVSLYAISIYKWCVSRKEKVL